MVQTTVPEQMLSKACSYKKNVLADISQKDKFNKKQLQFNLNGIFHLSDFAVYRWVSVQ